MEEQPARNTPSPDSKAEENDLFAYFRLLGAIDCSPMSRDEEQKTTTKFKETGDPQLREKILNRNLRFVVKIALQYRGYGFPLDDLVQEGNKGLIKALEKFDPERGYRFISYAKWWIKACIQEYILANWSMVKIGTTQGQREIFHGSQRRGGFSPEALAGKEGIDPAEIEETMLRIENRDASLNAPVDGDNGRALQDFLRGEESDDPQVALAIKSQQIFTRELICTVLKTLKERERIIIEGRHLAEPALKLRELGEKLGISKERVRYLQIRALGKLKVSIEERLNGGAKELIRDLTNPQLPL